MASDPLASGMPHHANIHMGSAIKSMMEHHPSFNPEKGGLGRSFITRTKPHLDGAIDHLNRFAEHISGVEMHCQSVLDGMDPGQVDLETKVRIEDLAKQHVINLKQLHQRQKVTLTRITELFLQLSKAHLKEIKKGQK